MTFEVKGQPALSVVIRLAHDEADYWVFKDVSNLKGKTLTISYEGNEKGLSNIYQDDNIKGEDNLYKENNRPQFHFLQPKEVGSMILTDLYIMTENIIFLSA